MKVFEYRANFIFWSVVNILWAGFNIFYFTLLVGVTGEIGGWQQNEIYLLLGVFTLIDAFTWSLFYANLREYASDIYDGRLSLLLQKPIDTQLYILMRRLNPQIIFRLLIGTVIIVYSLHQLSISLTPIKCAIFLGLISLSLILLYFFWFSLTTLAFYFERLENINEIIPAMRRIWQVPRTVFEGLGSGAITFLLPFILISSVPSEFLLEKQFQGNLALYFLFIVLVVVLFSRWFFHFSIRHYSGMAN